MDALTLDQLRIFRTVAETGSFSAAARRLNRAQSAVTYAVQKMEEQAGVELFDRSGYRPALSAAGRALLPRAAAILDEVAALGAQAHGIARGLEPSLSIVIDSMFPMCTLLRLLVRFQEAFPSVQTRLHVESLGATVQAVLDGTAELGVMSLFSSQLSADLAIQPMFDLHLVPVAAPTHPLAALPGPLGPDALRRHVQIVLTDRSPLTAGRDYGVHSPSTWRVADLGAKHGMLAAGLGWGSMPDHMVRADLDTGRLVPLEIADRPRLPMPLVAARRRDRILGPAGQWMMERLAETRSEGTMP